MQSIPVTNFSTTGLISFVNELNCLQVLKRLTERLPEFPRAGINLIDLPSEAPVCCFD